MNQAMADDHFPEGLCILIRRLRRGGVFFHSLYLVFLGCGCGALMFHWGIPWFILCFILGLICRLTVLLHVGRRYISARKVTENPGIVYWGYATDRQGCATDRAVTEANTIKLQLKDGSHLAVEAVRGAGITREQLREVIAWLRQKNPSIRWGNYDKPDSFKE
ncbi:MAG TPA: hypothetical protein VGI03_01635 [Verrucomicrobiae bacterium]|jgi:hypothetical protein